jgi:hypothetical protein
MNDDDTAMRLMRLYGLLRSTREEHGKGPIRVEIDRLLAQLQDAARAIEPAAAPAEPRVRRLGA